MAAYEYTALDASGRELRGVLEGDSARQVRQLLRDQSLLPVAVGEVSDKEAPRTLSFSFGNRLGTSDLALLTRQLATLVRAGIPLEEALLAVSQQNEKARVRSVVAGVRARVMEGRTLAEGLAAFPNVFPEIYRATVSAGEQSGHLDAVLERMADYTENRQVLQQKIRNAMIYPVLLTVVCLGVVGLLAGHACPRWCACSRPATASCPFFDRCPRSNPWFELFQPAMSIRFHWDAATRRELIRDHASKPGPPTEYGHSEPRSEANPLRPGYCVVAFLPNFARERNLLLFGGTDAESTGAGGHLLTDETALTESESACSSNPAWRSCTSRPC